jgi:putative ABC transport system permease protein
MMTARSNAGTGSGLQVGSFFHFRKVFPNQNAPMLLRNYYQTAVRQISRNRFHTGINIIGLSTGIAFALLIAVYSWSEWRVNRQFKDAGRQYILTSAWKDPNMGYAMATLGPLARSLKENYPTLVADYYRFDGLTVTVSNGDKYFREELQLGDSSLLTMFGLSLVQGDERTALNSPFTAVITDDRATQIFGTTDVVGKDLIIPNFSGRKQAFRITGVLKKLSRNSVTWLTSENTIFVPVASLDYFGRNMGWSNGHIANYVTLQPGVSPEALKGPIEHLIRQNADPAVAANLRVLPMALPAYYLHANGDTVRKMIYTLSLIAVFILGMAMINFVNLSVSRSALRMKEIGIRKVLGGMRSQLRLQFLMESVLLALAATGIALLLYIVLAPVFSVMLDREMPALSALPVAGWLLIVLLGALTGCLAGLYPAILLSSQPTVQVLKGKEGSVSQHVRIRMGLVGFQFGTAAAVFIGAIIVSQQIDLFFSDRLGYNKEYILASQVPRDWTPQGIRHMETIRSVFACMPAVRDVTLSFEIPNGANSGNLNLYRQSGDPSHPVVAQALVADGHYASTYRIPLASGVFFHRAGEDTGQDSTRVVLNETAARALGWKTAGEAVGQRVRFPGLDAAFTVSGVVRDFHFDAMGSAIQPEVFVDPGFGGSYRYLSFKLNPGQMRENIAALQQQWAKLMPGAPFDYKFMDESLATVYDSELRLRKAASNATVLAFIIVLLGVVGLVSGSVQRRAKEIAIRKVIGASVPGIIRLFLREYLPVLLGAALIADPLAAWIMQCWLDGYATRIIITAWPFLLANGSLALVVIGLIATQTLSVALTNPTRSLKAE